jgi:hypothetical protein
MVENNDTPNRPCKASRTGLLLVDPYDGFLAEGGLSVRWVKRASTLNLMQTTK